MVTETNGVLLTTLHFLFKVRRDTETDASDAIRLGILAAILEAALLIEWNGPDCEINWLIPNLYKRKEKKEEAYVNGDFLLPYFSKNVKMPYSIADFGI